MLVYAGWAISKQCARSGPFFGTTRVGLVNAIISRDWRDEGAVFMRSARLDFRATEVWSRSPSLEGAWIGMPGAERWSQSRLEGWDLRSEHEIAARPDSSLRQEWKECDFKDWLRPRWLAA